MNHLSSKRAYGKSQIFFMNLNRNVGHKLIIATIPTLK